MKDDKLGLVIENVTRSKVLLFETGVHWDEKEERRH